MSLRAASADLREHVLRTAAGRTSRQANLAVNYLDAFAPAVLAELHPTRWPRVVVLDTTTLFTRGFRSTSDDPGEAGTGNLRAGTILVALDGERRRPTPCLMPSPAPRTPGPGGASSAVSPAHRRSSWPISMARSAGPSATPGQRRS